MKTWWKCCEFYQFCSSEKCTQMCHYVPRSATDSQTQECVKLYGGSWKYPDLWKTQNRKTDLPLEMMRDSKNLNFHTGAHTQRQYCTEREHHRYGKICGVWESLVTSGSRMPAETCCQASRVCRRIWLDESTRGLAGEGPSGGVGHISALNSRDQNFF